MWLRRAATIPVAVALVGRTVVVRCWRHAAASVPREREAALAWLDARWLELDRWVDAQLHAQAAA